MRGTLFIFTIMIKSIAIGYPFFTRNKRNKLEKRLKISKFTSVVESKTFLVLTG